MRGLVEVENIGGSRVFPRLRLVVERTLAVGARE